MSLHYWYNPANESNLTSFREISRISSEQEFLTLPILMDKLADVFAAAAVMAGASLIVHKLFEMTRERDGHGLHAEFSLILSMLGRSQDPFVFLLSFCCS